MVLIVVPMIVFDIVANAIVKVFPMSEVIGISAFSLVDVVIISWMISRRIDYRRILFFPNLSSNSSVSV